MQVVFLFFVCITLFLSLGNGFVNTLETMAGSREEKIKEPINCTLAYSSNPYHYRTLCECLSELPADLETCLLSNDGGIGNIHPISVFSTTFSDDYFFFTPITALLWNRLGYFPLVLMVFPSSLSLPQSAQYVIRETLKVGAEIEFLHPHPTEGDVIISQVARLYAYMLNDDNHTHNHTRYLLTSDVDIWPLDSSHFRSPFYQHNADFHLHVHYANAFPQQEGKPPMYPMCYLGAEESVWKHIMNTTSESNFESTMTAVIDQAQQTYQQFWNHPNKAFSTKWYLDQLLFASHLEKASIDPSAIQRMSRNVGRDRIDRSYWHFSSCEADLPGKIDAHILRPGYTSENWTRLRTLLACLLTQDQMEWVDTYHVNYVHYKEQEL